MILTSDPALRNWSDAERESIAIGYALHRRVIEEGKAETASRTDGTRVCCNLDHDLIGTGKLPFVRWDERTKTVTRSFSKELAKDIRDHVEDLKVYFRYVKVCDRLVGCNEGAPPPASGTEGRSTGPACKAKGLRVLLTNEK